jgi:hypothetical protein
MADNLSIGMNEADGKLIPNGNTLKINRIRLVAVQKIQSTFYSCQRPERSRRTEERTPRPARSRSFRNLQRDLKRG